MKKLLSSLALSSFIVFAVLGFLAINGHFDEAHGCLASSAYGNACMMDNAFAAALFHINFLQSFSQAIIPLLAAIFLVTLIFGSGLLDIVFCAKFAAEKRLISFFQKPLLPLQYRFFDWFSVLRENLAV